MLDLARNIDDMDPDDVLIHSMSDDTFEMFDEFGNPSLPSEIQDATRHHVLMWDWSKNSFLIDLPPPHQNDGFAYGAGDTLYAFLRHYGIHDKVAYLIGHSRGAVVVSEATRRLLLSGHDPRQVIYLDGEGGDFLGLGYMDDVFDGWESVGPDPIRYDWIYSLVYEGAWVPIPDWQCPVCYCGADLGGLGCGNDECSDRLNQYNLGQAYRHGWCENALGGSPPPIWEYLIERGGPVQDQEVRDGRGMSFDGDLYFFFDQESPGATTTADPDQWHDFPNDQLLFNGDFEWGAPSGWDNHGGGGTASVDFLGAGDGWFLEMDFSTIERTHSFFWLDQQRTILSFEYDITDNDVINCDDDFKVTLTQAGTNTSMTWLVSSRCEETLDWTHRVLYLPENFPGSMCTLKLWKDVGPDGDIDSETRVDNVRFLVAGDVDGDGSVGIIDFLLVLGLWGPCADCNDCLADGDGDCTVGITDFLNLLGNWGS